MKAFGKDPVSLILFGIALIATLGHLISGKDILLEPFFALYILYSVLNKNLLVSRIIRDFPSVATQLGLVPYVSYSKRSIVEWFVRIFYILVTLGLLGLFAYNFIFK